MNVIYTGIFFEFSEERREMLEWITEGDWMPNKFAHHITLQFRPKSDSEHVDWVVKNQGLEVTVTATGSTHPGQNVAAISVELPPEIAEHCTNKTPHLTIATAEGVRPFEANNATYDPFEIPKGSVTYTRFELTGKVGFFLKGERNV